MLFLFISQLAIAEVKYSKVFDVSIKKGPNVGVVECLVEFSDDRGWNMYVQNEIKDLGLSGPELDRICDSARNEAMNEKYGFEKLEVISTERTEKAPRVQK